MLGTGGEERERSCSRTLHTALLSWQALTLAEGRRSELHSYKTPLHHCPLYEEGNMPSMSTTIPGQMVPSFLGRAKTLLHMSPLGNYCSLAAVYTCSPCWNNPDLGSRIARRLQWELAVLLKPYFTCFSSPSAQHSIASSSSASAYTALHMSLRANTPLV